MIDVHCHLNFHAYKNDYDEVIKRAFAAGITKIINVGTQISSSVEAVKLAEQYENLYAIVGVHPHHADKIGEGNWLDPLKQLTRNPKVIGIGEIGMDYYSYQSNGIVDPKMQRDIFEAQIQLAHDTNLPLQIHHRQVGQELIDILKHHKNLLKAPVPGMFHCFAGSKEFLKQVLDLGFYIGFDGNSTYPGIAKGETVALTEHIKYVPLDRIVVETDSPFLAPVPHRGERNEPSYAIITGQFLAEMKQIPFAQFVEQTTKNVYTIFTKLKPMSS